MQVTDRCHAERRPLCGFGAAELGHNSRIKQVMCRGTPFAAFCDVTPTDATESCAFYNDVVERLRRAEIPFVVGGAFAFAHFTGIHRDTKDLDLMLKREDVTRALSLFEQAGYRSALTFPHWLAKVYETAEEGSDFVDLIFNSGNGVAEVDDDFFRDGANELLFEQNVGVCPIEEMIWTKAFVMERERYDGADIAHLLHCCGAQIDWGRLVRRFGEHWRLLLVHVTLLGYIYPNERLGVPAWVVRGLLARFEQESRVRSVGAPVCGGTLVSRQQFLVDVLDWGYVDGRLAAGVMSEDEIDAWTRAIGRRP